MLRVLHILAAWSPEQWGQFLGYLSTFLTLALLPVLLKIFSAIKDLRNRAQANEVRTATAEVTANLAHEGVVNANNRIVTVAALSSPTTPAPPPPQPRAPVPVVPPTKVIP